jgi:4-hydroxy-tetrahydrodipicolinate synthase
VYSGNDIEFGDFVRAGGTGAVSGVSSVFPRPFLELADALHRSDEQAAAAAQDRVKQAVEALGGADIALIKAGLSLQGLPAGPTRVALDTPTPAQLETLRTAVQGLT